jgi:hypothetical protein
LLAMHQLGQSFWTQNHHKKWKPHIQKTIPSPEAHRGGMETQFKDWPAMGLIQPSWSRYNSPERMEV